jgi:succinoglycan biosynthesis protein ExoU
MTSTADVCVIVPAYNAVRTIGRAVRSALAQRQAIEVVVVDDGSTDGTADAARAADDGTGRLKILVQPVSGGGPAAARNRALAESHAPWVCPLDADDYFLPGRLKILRRLADNWDFVADDLLRASEQRPDGPFTTLLPESGDGRLTLAQFVEGNISRPGRPRCELGFLKPLMRRAFLERHGLRYDENLRLGEDFILYARILAAGARSRLIAACGYVAVERADSLSGCHSRHDLAALLRAAQPLAELPLGRQDRSALRAHRQHLAAKIKLREVIDTRRARGYRAAAMALAGSPLLAPYVLSRTLADIGRRGLVKGLAERAERRLRAAHLPGPRIVEG